MELLSESSVSVARPVLITFGTFDNDSLYMLPDLGEITTPFPC